MDMKSLFQYQNLVNVKSSIKYTIILWHVALFVRNQVMLWSAKSLYNNLYGCGQNQFCTKLKKYHEQCT